MSKIFLDPGHGGSDPGAVGNGLQEKNVVLDIAKHTRDYLQNNYSGVNVRMSRTGDSFPSLTDRTNNANSWGADIFVSIHINAFNGSAHGYEDFIFNGSVSNNTRRLQDNLHKQIAPLFRNNRGKKRANFAVLRQSNMPAVLTESGFIDNSQDAAFLKSDRNLKRIAEAHAKGIAAYLGLSGGSSSSGSSGSSSGIQWVGTNDKGKELIITAASVNYYDTQRWTNPTGSRKRGFAWKIDNLYRVNGSLQYRVQDANGNLFYTTGRSDLVRVGGNYTGSSSSSKTSNLPNSVYRANRPYPSGSGVRAVQEALASVYYYPDKGAPNNGVDGYYGPKTADAVRRFQSMHVLVQDGVYGPKTRAALIKAMN